MSAASPPRTATTWSKPRLIQSAWLRWLVIAAVGAYFFFAVRSIGIDVPRIVRGLQFGLELAKAFSKPDFVSRAPQILVGVFESMAMTVVGTLLSLVLTVPIALGAARNISPRPVYVVCRSLLMVLRSVHVVIMAIFSVVMFGFGPFAGVVTIVINGIGFLGKMLAESIESINERGLEAIRSTGATWSQIVLYAVWPQVAARFAGLAIYRADQSFRESTVIGLVGAGGVGAVLNTAMGRYDYNTAAAMLIVIVVLVMLGEYASARVRGGLV